MKKLNCTANVEQVLAIFTFFQQMIVLKNMKNAFYFI